MSLRGNVIIRKAQKAIQADDCPPRYGLWFLIKLSLKVCVCPGQCCVCVLLLQDLLHMCVYYCRTYYKDVRVGGGG
jgi:hypothetical protein